MKSILLAILIAATASAGVRQLSPDTDYADSPALAAAPNGDLFAAWVSYDQKGADEIRLRRYTAGQWQEPVTVTQAAGDYFKVALAMERNGRLWVSWAARVNDNVDLYARTWTNGKWSGEMRLTSDPQPDFHHRMIADSAGNVYLCWESFRAGNANITLKVYDGKRWSDDIAITRNQAANSEPALALDGHNRLHIVYDTYRHGDYDVYLRIYDHGKLSEEVPIAASKRFEARATVACDPQGRAWIAWDEQGESWGLDRPFWNLSSATGDWGPAPAWSTDDPVSEKVSLRFSQRIGVAVFTNGRLQKPKARLDDALPAAMAKSFEIPHLVVDGGGVPWLLFRRWVTRAGDNTSRPSGWNIWASSYRGERWTPPVKLDESTGSNDQRAATATDSGGRLWVAYPADGRLSDGKIGRLAERQGKIYVTTLESAASSPPVLVAAESPAARADRRTAPADRRNAIVSGAKHYQLYWGDLHRHTEISGDGGYDGTLWDMYRYAMDVAELDFVGTTDHFYGGPGKDGNLKTYDWWRTQKLADLFHVRGKFLPLFSYERSLSWPYGHRNVISPRRGSTAFPSTVRGAAEGERQAEEPRLWAAIRGRETISIPHTIATGHGTDWSYNDPALETVMEIYQGCRMSYETLGAPRVADKGDHPQGYAWSALKKGYKVGFIASSDHRSTHISYAAVYAEAPTREAIFRGLQQRHTYAATDNIVVDVRMGNAMLGDETTTDRPPELRVKVRGTAPIHQIQVIRNGAYVYAIQPGKREVSFDYRDANARSGESYYYYVRLQQDDGQMAWVSPIWVNYTAR